MADSETPTPNQGRVLLVEGRNDQRVVGSLRHNLNDIPSFEVLDRGGIDPLLKSISVEVKVPGRQVVGILVDANDDPAARWQAIGDRLAPEFTLPDKPDVGGTIVGTDQRIGVWLMPDNKRPGELEDFVIEMIPDDDPVWPQAQRYIEGIDPQHREFADGKQQRAALHAWLATRKDTGLMGTAIQAGYLKTDGPLCQEFVGWLRRLFA